MEDELKHKFMSSNLPGLKIIVLYSRTLSLNLPNPSAKKKTGNLEPAVTNFK